MKKLLLINNNTIDGSSKSFSDLQKCLVELGVAEDEMEVIVGNDTKLASVDEEKYRAVILSGGRRWFDYDEVLPQQQFIKNTNLKTLGICYGHQLLGFCYGAERWLDELPQLRWGWQQIKLEENNFDKWDTEMLAGAPKKFWAFESHRFVIGNLNEQIKLLASSADGVEMIRIKDKQMWGIQFHPERSVVAQDATAQRILSNFLKIASENSFIY